MKFIRTFESYELNSTCPSREEMISHLYVCGYNESECGEMSMDELEMHYNKEVGGMTYEARKNKKVAKKARPDFLDLDKDGNKKESMKKASKDSKEVQAEKGNSKADDKKNQSQAQGKLSDGQKKLPPALQKAIMVNKK